MALDGQMLRVEPVQGVYLRALYMALQAFLS